MAKPGSRRSRRANPAAAARGPRGGRWLAILAAALLLRLLYVFSIRGAYFFDHLQTEPLRYQEWATLIVDGPQSPPPPFEQAPGYAYFVAAVYAFVGRSAIAVALVQAILDAVSCVLIALAAHTWFGARVGVVAGLLAACYGPFIYFTGEVLPATLLIFVTMLALIASGCAVPLSSTEGAARPKPAWFRSPSWWVAGGLWGIAALVRSEIALAWPFVVLDAWKRGGRRALAGSAVPIACILAGLIAVNGAFSHRLVLFTTSGGVNLWLGNNPHADGVNPFIFGPLEGIADSLRARAADPVEMDHLFTARALAFWREQPGAALRLLGRKFLWTWTDRELPNSSDIDWQTGHSWLFRLPFFPPTFGAVLPFAVAGVLLLGGAWTDAALLAALPAVALGTSLLFFTNARFRLIMVPSVLILAAMALDRTATFARDWRRHRAALTRVAGGVALGAAAAFANFSDVQTYRIPQISVNTGVLERESGQLTAAVRHLREGLSGDPDDAIAWVHLALALEQQGELRPALQAYLDALARLPADGTLQQMAGRFVARHQLNLNLLQQYVTTEDPATREATGRQLLESLQSPPAPLAGS